MDRMGVTTRTICLGKTRVLLRFAGPTLLPFAAPLAHQFGPGPAGPNPAGPPEAQLTIELWDAASTGVLPPPWPRDEDVPAKGQVRRYAEAGVWVRFSGGVRRSDGAFAAMTVFDERASVISYFVSTPDWIPWHERSAPLRTALQWGLAGPDRLLVHAGAVGRDGRCVLLAGRAGSGKSTMAVAALLADCDFLGDDYLFVALGAPHPVAHSLHATAKLAPEALTLLPGLAGHAALRLPAGADKHVLNVGAIRPDGLRRSARIMAIVVPQVEPLSGPRVGPRLGRRGRPQTSPAAGLERCSPGAALLALAASTVLQAPQRDAAELGPLAKLVRSVPAYRLALSETVAPITGVIDQLIGLEA
jgi:hypothetical protein